MYLDCISLGSPAKIYGQGLYKQKGGETVNNSVDLTAFKELTENEMAMVEGGFFGDPEIVNQVLNGLAAGGLISPEMTNQLASMFGRFAQVKREVGPFVRNVIGGFLGANG